MKDTIKPHQDMLQAILSVETYAVSPYDAFLEDDPEGSCLLDFFNFLMGD